MYPLCALNPWTSTITARGVPFGVHDRVKIFRPSAFLKDDSFTFPPLSVASLQPMLQFGRGVPEERPGRGLVCEPVQQAEIVDRAVVANGRHLHAGLVEPPTVGLAFVAQDVVLGNLDQRRGQSLQLFEARSQR